MANVIKHKRGSGSDPVASDLVVGEVAIRTDVGKLFTKMDNGSVAEIAGGGSDIAINTLSSSSGTGGGSATFNGSAFRFTLSAPPSVSAQQLLVSINGVIQKPVAGTGQPSEGFSVDGTDIILGDAPATGSDFFILTFKSLGVSEPADNSVTTAKIVDNNVTEAKLALNSVTNNRVANGAITNAKIGNSAIDTAKLQDDAVTSAKIADGAIVNADINASAAIAASKIADFVTGNTNNRLLTATGTANNLNGESKLTFDGNSNLTLDAIVTVDRVINATDSADPWLKGVDSSNNETCYIKQNGQAFFNGNVGIGTNNPSQKLHVVGTAVEFQNTQSTYIQINTSDTHFYTGGSHPLRFGTNSTERMRIDSSGNVGMNTASPTSHLQIGDGTIDSGNVLTFGKRVSGPNSNLPLIGHHSDGGGSGIGICATSSGGSIHFFTGNDAAGFGTGNNAERMRIDLSGNVGIGTTTPQKLLDVRGEFAISNSNSSYWNFDRDDSDGSLKIKDTGTERMSIDSSGDLRVQRIHDNTTSGGANVRVQSDGLMQRDTSSRRYKNTIADATHGLADLNKLRSVTYKGNNDGDTIFGGLIAEEVHDAGLIEFVDYNSNNEPDALRYGNMVSLCIKSIQQLSAKFETLEAALQEAIGRIETLEAK